MCQMCLVYSQCVSICYVFNSLVLHYILFGFWSIGYPQHVDDQSICCIVSLMAHGLYLLWWYWSLYLYFFVCLLQKKTWVSRSSEVSCQSDYRLKVHIIDVLWPEKFVQLSGVSSERLEVPSPFQWKEFQYLILHDSRKASRCVTSSYNFSYLPIKSPFKNLVFFLCDYHPLYWAYLLSFQFVQPEKTKICLI